MFRFFIHTLFTKLAKIFWKKWACKTIGNKKTDEA